MKKYFRLFIFLLLFIFIGCDFSSRTYYKVEVYDANSKLIKVYTLYDGADMVNLPTVTKGDEIFLGWDYTDDGVPDEIPSKVTSNMTFVPVFKSEDSYTITFKNYDGTILEVAYFKKGETPAYSKATPVKDSTVDKDYTFIGWNPTLDIVSSDQEYAAQYKESDRLYTYNFYDEDGKLLLSNSGKYNTTITYPSDPSKKSDLEFNYIFMGWSIDSNDLVTNVTLLTQDYNFTPVFKKSYINYTIKFYQESVLLSSEEYHYGDTVNVPLMESVLKDGTYYGFVGWDVDDDGNCDEVTPVSKSVNYYALYTDSQLLFIHLDENLYAYYFEKGKEIDLSNFVAKKGYKYVWYLDSEYNNLLLDYTMPNGNLTLYGKLEVLFNLNNDVLEYSPSSKVSSREEFQVLYNYIVFNMITNYQVKLDYEFSDVNTELTYVNTNATIKDNYSLSTKYSPIFKDLTLEFTYQEKNIMSSTASYTQVVNVTCNEYTSTRDSSYQLYIDNVTKTYNVKNSEQLFYVLVHGYRPIIEDSSLKTLYAKMRNVLIEIVDDRMNDYEKATAIYEWIINEVTYDGITFEKVINGNSNVSQYHCFYLEGVFNDKLAVCDGISKAFASLCSMEGIPCVQISGVSKATNVNHAWNKILIGDNWYIVDATSGGTVVSNSFEVLTHKFLLIDEDEYSSYYKEEVNPDYDFYANGKYNFYSNKIISYNEKDYDLSCDNIEDMVELFKVFYNICASGESFELQLNFDYGLSVSDEIQEVIERIHDDHKFFLLHPVLPALEVIL